MMIQTSVLILALALGAQAQLAITIPPNWQMVAGEVLASGNQTFTTLQNFLGQAVRFAQNTILRLGADFQSDSAILTNGTLITTDNNATFNTRQLLVQNGTAVVNGTFAVQQNVTIDQNATLYFWDAVQRAASLLPTLFTVNQTLAVRGSLIIDPPVTSDYAMRVDSLQCDTSSQIFVYAKQPQASLSTLAVVPRDVIVVNTAAHFAGDLIIVMRDNITWALGYKLPLFAYASFTGAFARVLMLPLFNMTTQLDFWSFANATTFAVPANDWTIRYDQNETYLLYQPVSLYTTTQLPATTYLSTLQSTLASLYETTTYLSTLQSTLQQSTLYETTYLPTSTAYLSTATATTSYPTNLPIGWTYNNSEIIATGMTTITLNQTFTQLVRFSAAAVVTINATLEATQSVVLQRDTMLIVDQSAQLIAQHLEIAEGQAIVQGPVLVRDDFTIQLNTSLYLAAQQQSSVMTTTVVPAPYLRTFEVDGTSLTVRGELRLDVAPAPFEVVRCHDLVFEQTGSLVLIIDLWAVQTEPLIICNDTAAWNNAQLIIMFRNMPAQPKTFVSGDKILVAQFASMTGQFSSVTFVQQSFYNGEWRVVYESTSMYLQWFVQGQNDQGAAPHLGVAAATAVAAAALALM